MMRSSLWAGLTFFISIIAATGNGIRKEDLAAGKLVPNSESPDGKMVMLEVNYGDTTATGVVIAPVDRSKYFSTVPLRTEYSTDRPYKSRASIEWNATSSLVAVHDSLNRLSKVSLLRASKDRVTRLEVPDLLKLTLQQMRLDPAAVRTSGQVPIRWVDDSTIEVKVRIAMRSGKKWTKIQRLVVAKDGKVSLATARKKKKVEKK